MKKIGFFFSILLITYGCVSPKEFQATNSRVNSKLYTIENEIESLEKTIFKLNNEITKLSDELKNEKLKHSKNVQQLEQQLDSFKKANKNLRDLISNLRIEVASLIKQINN